MTPFEKRWINGELQVQGEMDLSNADQLIEEVQSAGLESDLVLDLSRLTFIDVYGARAILRTSQVLGQVGYRVFLHDPTRAVQRVFDILGLQSRGIDIMRGPHEGHGPAGSER